MRAFRPWTRSASPVPGQSTIRHEIPRAASSSQCPEEYMCSFVESSPFQQDHHRGGPSSVAGAWLK